MPAPSLRAQRACFSFSDRPLLDDVSCHLAPGWAGLVGANGSGKSTLLELLGGVRAPSSGQVRREPEGGRVVLCPQRVDSASELVHAFASADDGDARRLQGLMELHRAPLERWATLTPGERERWQVGAALWQAPTALLLDEPTNHVDAPATEPLVRALERFDGVGVLQVVHALGVEPDDLLRSDAPSPGEARKLRLALGLGQSAWLAVLDEPENHLDLPSLERLEAALAAFPGALLFVSHDAALMQRLAHRTWHCEGGLLVER